MTRRTNPPTNGRTPGVVFQPQTYLRLQQGINLLVDAIKPTLGPRPRLVALASVPPTQAPELLDKGALIARRITGLADPDAAMGAMLVRQMLWQQYEAVGDGTATTAVLFRSLFNDGVKHITAGGNAMRLRGFLLEGLGCVLEQLGQQQMAVEGREQITQIALTLSHDPVLAAALGEAFEVLGPFGQVNVRGGHGRGLEHEYVHGVYWDGGVHAQELILDSATRKTDLQHCAIFLSDLEFDDPRDLLPIIEAGAEQSRALVLVASKLSERAVGLLTHINKTPERFQAVAVKLPTDRGDQVYMLEELAMMTGARPFLQIVKDDAAKVQPHDLGSADRVWANRDYFCVVEDADAGTRRATYLTDLHCHYQRATEYDQREALRQRIGRLMGASATLLVGGMTRADIEVRKEAVKGVVATLRSCLEQGVVDGGGMALLNCQPALQQRLQTMTDPDARAAYLMLIHALETPLRHLVDNAGLEPGAVLAQLQHAPAGHGYDVTSGQVKPLRDAGILDSAAVTASAVERAVRTVALALTVDVLVHQRNPAVSANS